MAVKLHRCKNEWVKIGGHPCWRVQKALDEASVEYEIVHERPTFRRAARENTIKRTGPAGRSSGTRACNRCCSSISPISSIAFIGPVSIKVAI